MHLHDAYIYTTPWVVPNEVADQWTELPYRRVRVLQPVAAQLQAIWADAVAEALEYIRNAAKRRHHDGIAAGIHYLVMLASEVLGDKRGGHRRQRGAAARVRDLRKCARAASMRADATGSNHTRGRMVLVAEHAIAGLIHRHIRNGNDGRAARCLDSGCMAVVDDATIALLKALHPQAPPPVPRTVVDGPAGPAQLDADRFLGILQRLPQGAASGVSGWKYEHVLAAGLHSQRTRDAMRGFVNDLLQGDISHCHLLLASRKIAPQGGVRLIAIEYAFLRFSSNCALSTAQNAADLRTPLQICVGISGGFRDSRALAEAGLLHPRRCHRPGWLAERIQPGLPRRHGACGCRQAAESDGIPAAIAAGDPASRRLTRSALEQGQATSGRSCGPLLFAMTYQPTQHATQYSAADEIVAACHVDTNLQ